MRDKVSLLVAKDLDLLGLKEGNDPINGFWLTLGDWVPFRERLVFQLRLFQA